MQVKHESQYLGDRNDLPPTSGSIHDISLSDKKLAWCLRTIAVVLAVAQTWKSRYIIFSDGISYLEIAEAYSQQDWMNAINSYWSPLYSWVLAAFSAVLSPHPAWSVPMLHAVNFLSFSARLPRSNISCDAWLGTRRSYRPECRPFSDTVWCSGAA